MRISRAVAVAGLLALAVAGCSSDSGSDTPDPAALASGIAAQATSPAAAPSSDAGGGNQAVGSCEDGRLSAKAALTATIADDVSLPDGCTSLSVTVPDDTDAAVGQSLCSTAASEAFRYGIAGVAVVTASGTKLATGTAPSTECTIAG